MRQLRDDTHLILDGEVRVYRRERSKRWQAAFVIDGHTIHIDSVGYCCVGRVPDTPESDETNRDRYDVEYLSYGS